MDFVHELKWRGLYYDMTPGTDTYIRSGNATGYIGFDPTADSLHIGSLIQIMLLVHFQKTGNKPIALIGGATGLVGDPSGKSEERKLLPEEQIRYNAACIQRQLGRFIEFTEGKHAAEMLNNFDWFGQMGFLDFIRDVGKHITVNYMLAKDSVKKRLESGMSFTEFSYQLIQAYDFYWLYAHRNCKLQMGGSDQWGNIVTGTELIRRKNAGEAYGLTSPLIIKTGGGKFGKTESGNIWLDKSRTSPYQMYQFWLNASDEDALRFIRMFTLLEKEEIEAIEKEHLRNPHLRIVQKKLAREVTAFVHSGEDAAKAENASAILFGKGTKEALMALPESDFLSVFEGVPMCVIAKSELEQGIGIVELLSIKSHFLQSKSEAIRNLKENAISVNKEKVKPDKIVRTTDLISNKYILLQKGKKTYFLLKAG